MSMTSMSMTSVMALDGVMSFSGLKGVTITCKQMRHSQTIGWDFLSAMVESLKKLKTSNVFTSFIVC